MNEAAYLDAQSGPPMKSFVFHHCKAGKHEYCGRSFQARKADCYCSCECHTDDYVDYMERRYDG